MSLPTTPRPGTRRALFAATLLAGSLAAGHALAWGHTGHVLIGELAVANLPNEVPAVVRNTAAVYAIGELAAEADVSKDSGDAATPGADVHDFERDPGHFVDLDDNGYVAPAPGYPEVAALQIDNLLIPYQGRRDFDTLLRQNGATPTTATQYSGYLPFNMVDRWQQMRKDFAYYRAFAAAVANPATAAADRLYFRQELELRKKLLVRDIGYWAHFVGDGSQPMHVSIHYNGWGPYPNPNGYTEAPIHAPFEGYFVKSFITAADVQNYIGRYVSCEQDTGLASCAGIEPRVRVYLRQTLATVIPLYGLTKALGGDNPWTTTAPTTLQKSFVAQRLAAGAAEMRDEIVDAWHSSDTIYVGYPLVKVRDIESGAVVWTASAFAGD
jgi:hypothetical protein